MKVTHGFVSFTEVAAGAHHSYNEWHLFDHMPEQYPLDGIDFGQRWVLTPALRAHMRADAPLDRTHYVTLYLMREPIDDTLRAFQSLAVELRELDRFHMHRTSHLAGAMKVVDQRAAERALVRAEAVPYRPNRGVHVRLGDGPATVDHPAVAGVWTFETDDFVATWCWLDGDPEQAAPTLVDDSAKFSATFATVDPWASWDWFEH